MLTLLSSGSNAHGQLASGSIDDSHTFTPCTFYGFPPGCLPSETSQILNIVCGANHTLILLEVRKEGSDHKDTEIWGCGDGSVGQLGNDYRFAGDITIFRKIELPLSQNGLSGYNYKMIAASWQTSYFVLSCRGQSDVVLSIGSNDFGGLGVGTLEGNGKMKDVPFHVVKFGHLVIHDVPLPNPVVINSLAAGQHHVVIDLQVSLMDGSHKRAVVGWGTARHGQLGENNCSTFHALPAILFASNWNDSVSIPPALGSQHTVLLGPSGGIRGLGSNRKNQLEGIELFERIHSVGCTWNGTYIMTLKDNAMVMFSTGSSSHGQLGRVGNLEAIGAIVFPEDHTLQTFACGSEHVLVTLAAPRPSENGINTGETVEVWGWGWNEHGNLGVGRTKDVFTPVRIWQGGDYDVNQQPVGIWAGAGTSWILCTTC